MPTDQLYDKCDPDSDAYSPEFAAAWDKAVPQVPSIFGHAALSYQRKGVEVIPLRPGRKEPVTKHGLNDSSDNPMQCVIWWGKDRGNPRYNVGMATGQPSGGIIVIDLDVHDDAANGIETLRDWEVNHGKLPETWQQETGSGGRQLFYRVSYEIRNSANAELGVDVRGDGGYVVMPPSIHPSGEAYEWITSPDDMDVAEADNRVYEFLDYVRTHHTEEGSSTKANGKFKLPETINQGERDTTLFKYACHLRAIHRTDEEILTTVMGANAMRCNPPMGRDEVEHLVESACRYKPGQSNPIDTDAVVLGKPGETGPAHKMKDETTEKIQNILLSLDEIRDGIKRNRYDGRVYVVSDCIPGVTFYGPHIMTDGEQMKLLTHLEYSFGVRSRAKFLDALQAFAETEGQEFDPMAEAVNSLPLVRPLEGETMTMHGDEVEVSDDGGDTWERRERCAGNLFAMCFNSTGEYVEEAERLILRQLLARATHPGCKADIMPVLVGPQGVGKSTFVSKLALDENLFIEGFSSFGDEDLKRITGKLVVEIPELDGFARRDMNLIKSVITRQVDTYRDSYARNPMSHPRTAIFFGTTNDTVFLTDQTGNRRFLPIECGKEGDGAEPGLFDGTIEKCVRQAWAETVAEMREVGEKRFMSSLVLPAHIQREAIEKQSEYVVDDSIDDMVQTYLETTTADVVNVRKVMFEGLDYDKQRYAAERSFMIQRVTNAINRAPGWERCEDKQRIKGWGISHVWVRTNKSGQQAGNKAGNN
jgi:hypothetical protein